MHTVHRGGQDSNRLRRLPVPPGPLSTPRSQRRGTEAAPSSRVALGSCWSATYSVSTRPSAPERPRPRPRTVRRRHRPASTIRMWAHRGLITGRWVPDGVMVYRAREVLARPSRCSPQSLPRWCAPGGAVGCAREECRACRADPPGRWFRMTSWLHPMGDSQPGEARRLTVTSRARCSWLQKD